MIRKIKIKKTCFVVGPSMLSIGLILFFHSALQISSNCAPDFGEGAPLQGEDRRKEDKDQWCEQNIPSDYFILLYLSIIQCLILGRIFCASLQHSIIFSTHSSSHENASPIFIKIIKRFEKD